VGKNVLLLFVLAVVNTPLYILLGNLLFGRLTSFWAAVKLWFTPSVVAVQQRGFRELCGSSFKVSVVVLSGVGLVWGQYALIRHLFPV
jgi:hypothetical protein